MTSLIVHQLISETGSFIQTGTPPIQPDWLSVSPRIPFQPPGLDHRCLVLLHLALQHRFWVFELRDSYDKTDFLQTTIALSPTSLYFYLVECVVVLASETSLVKHAWRKPWLNIQTHSSLSLSTIFLHMFEACLCILVHFLAFKMMICSNEAIVDCETIFCQKSFLLEFWFSCFFTVILWVSFWYHALDLVFKIVAEA